MSAVVSAVVDFVEGVGDAVGAVVKGVGDVLQEINHNIIEPAAKIVSNTINNALKDPIGTIAKIATAVYAPYLLPAVNAADVLAHGGSMDDAFKTAALTWVGQEAFSNLELGSETLADGSTQAITPKSLSSDFGNFVAENASSLGTVGQDILGNAAVQGTLGAVKGGLMAAIQGKDIGDGIAEGATSGALGGGISAGFADATKSLGINTVDKTTALAGKTILAIAEGKDPNAFLANYLAYTVNSAGADVIAKTSKDAYDAFSLYSKDFSEKNSKYEDDLALYKSDRQKISDENDALQKEVKDKWSPVQAKLDKIIDEQNTIKQEFDKQKAIYDDTSKSVDERNAAADKMETLSDQYKAKSTAYDKLFEANKSTYTALSDKRTDIETRLNKLDDTTGASLQKTRSELENDVKTLSEYREKYENASEAYDTAIAEATTKNVLIDAVNNGTISGELQSDGSILLANGMTIKDGQFYQDGKNAFANADPIEQAQIRFTDKDGNQVWFNNDRSQQVSATDAQKILFDDYGIKADQADVLGVVGQNSDAIDTDSFKAIAENKVNEQYNSLLGRDATQEELDAALTPGQDTLANVAGNLADEILPTDQFFSSEDEKIKYAKQLAAVRADKGVGAEFTWVNPYSGEVETHQAFTNEDAQNQDAEGSVQIDDGAFTSQWQTVGDKRVFIHDDGSASVIDPETGETSSLDQSEVDRWISQGLLNSWDSGYYQAIGRSGLSAEDLAAQEDGGGGPDTSDYERAAAKYTGVLDTRPKGSAAGIINQLMQPDRTGGMSGSYRGVLPSASVAGQPKAAPKGTLPTGNPLEQDYLNIGLSKEKFIDPLSQLYQIQQATAPGGEGDLAQMMFQQFNPTATTEATQPTQASGMGDSYYNYGQADDTYTGAIDPFSPSPYTPSPYAAGFEAQGLTAAGGGAIMATPLMARGGKTLPLNVTGVLPAMHQGRENFKEGKHVAGEGDGQSDDIPAWLADGEFVFPADVVSALGNGSTKAGTDKLYAMMHSIREHARSTKPKDLPPPAKKSPLDYLKA